MYADTLKLIVTADRRYPSPRLPERLNGLFRSLGDASGKRAEHIEDEIWTLWMAYRDSAAAFDLERATRALTALDFPAALRRGRRVSSLVANAQAPPRERYL